MRYTLVGLIVVVLLLGGGYCWPSSDIFVVNCSSSGPFGLWTYNASPKTLVLAVGIDTETDCLDANLGGQYPHTWFCSPTSPNPNQVWNLKADGSTTTIVPNGAPSSCLTAYDNFENSIVVIQSCSSGYNKWVYNAHNLQIQLAGTDLCLAGGFNASCQIEPYNTYPYCNANLPPIARAQDFVSRLSLAEKAISLQNANPGVPRLGMIPLQFNEALHGVVNGCGAKVNDNTGCPTSFPHATVLASTFNSSLWSAVGEAISTEARALNNQNIGGLFYWAPGINITYLVAIRNEASYKI
jgi:hypothetical protein